MPHFAPATLATITSGHWTVTPARPLTAFSHDTRHLRPNDIFVALRTPARDGHDYLPAAQAAGAAAAIVARPIITCPLPQLVVPDPLAAFQQIAAAHRAAYQAAGGIVIAISGSAGKTSTKELLALILSRAFGAERVHATEGNLNNHIGVPLTLTRLELTPRKRRRYAIIEAGISAPGEMEPLAAMISPDHAIITTIAPAHAQNFANLDAIAREKSILLRHVRRKNGARIFPALCLEYPAFRDMPDTMPVVPVEKVGKGLGFAFSSRSLGMHRNAGLVTELAMYLGAPPEQIQIALDSWTPAKWRGEVTRDATGRLFYLDFYNANPASMRDALDTFDRVAPRALPRLYVLGCMEELGPESARYHRELGLALKLRPQDEALLIGDHAPDLAASVNAPPAQITIAATTAEIAPRVATFQGSIFLKASRRYALEKTLPPDLLAGAAAPSFNRNS